VPQLGTLLDRAWLCQWEEEPLLQTFAEARSRGRFQFCPGWSDTGAGRTPGPFGRSPASRTRADQYEREGLFYVCLYCADLDDVHWSDSGGGERGELSPSGVRVRRLGQLRELLAPYRWTVDQPGSTRQLVLSSPTGSTELVADLGALWFLTDRLLPNRLDPLDPELLSRLEAGADRRGFEA